MARTTKKSNTNSKKSKRNSKKGYDIEKVLAEYVAKAHGLFHGPRGNSKLGEIPAFNLAPVLTCSAEACNTCAKQGCYAVKNMCRCGYDYDKNTTMQAWFDNTKLAKEKPQELEKQLDLYLSVYELNIAAAKFFRIHASGDFFNVEYALMWYRLAEKHPSIKFLAFTKQWDKVRPVPFYQLKNFSLVLSGWTGVTIPADLMELYPVAYCVEPGQTPPENALECPGSCETCGACWFLREIGKNTYFHKH